MKELQNRGFSVELHTSLDAVAERANELFVKNKLRTLTAVGGDGTIAELINRTKQGVTVSVLPAGTANLIAKYFKLPFDPIKAAELIQHGSPMVLDVGKANGRLFLVMASAGIDADVVNQVQISREKKYRLNKKDGGHISYLSYLYPSFKSIVNYKYPKIRTELITENGTRSILGKWSFIFNLPCYGWGLPLAPQSVGNDQKLDYCIFQGGKFLLTLFDVLAAQLWGLHRFMPNTKLGRGKRFRLTPENVESEVLIPYQIDGEPGGFLPVEIEIEPKRFAILASADRIERLKL